MRAIYFARVFFISFEFAALVTMAISMKLFNNQANTLASSLAINDELIKWVILLPITLCAWSIKESRDIVQSNQEHNKILVNWPDYWQLKQHIITSVIFGLIFCALSIIPWTSKTGISTGEGLIIFSIGCLGNLIVAAHLYLAKMSINEILLAE